jgi:hypothetical protein
MKKLALFGFLFCLTFNAQAASTCDEWATMVQVLVVRWQMDEQFQGKTNADVRQELLRSMGGHAEIETALGYVDYAYQNRTVNTQDIWMKTYNQCKATAI